MGAEFRLICPSCAKPRPLFRNYCAAAGQFIRYDEPRFYSELRSPVYIPAMVHPDPFPARLVTFHNVACRLRRLHSGDETRLQNFFYSHSKETIHLRYGYTFTSMSRGRAHQLVDVVEGKGLALGIFSVEGGHEVLHAVGRYCVETPQTAEVAFVVRESERHHGMATALLYELAHHASVHGIRFLRAEVLRENLPMRQMMERYRSTVKDDPESDQLAYLLNVERLNETYS